MSDQNEQPEYRVAIFWLAGKNRKRRSPEWATAEHTSPRCEICSSRSGAWHPLGSSLGVLYGDELLAQERNNFPIVFNDSKAAMLEYRSVGIRIDCGDIFRFRETRHVLTGAGDGDGQIQIRSNFL